MQMTRFCINKLLKITKIFNIDYETNRKNLKIILYVILTYIKYLTNIKVRIDIDMISINFDVIIRKNNLSHLFAILKRHHN